MNKRTAQLNIRVSPELKDAFNRIVAHRKQGEIAESLIRAFIKDPSIAGHDGLVPHADFDDIGLMGGMWRLDYADLAKHFLSARTVQIYASEFAQFWHLHHIRSIIPSRIREPDTVTVILFPHRASQYDAPIIEQMRKLVDDQKGSTCASTFHVGQLREDQHTLHNTHVLVDDILYVGNGHTGEGPNGFAPYLTVWRPSSKQSQYELASEEFYHVMREAMWLVSHEGVANIP